MTIFKQGGGQVQFTKQQVDERVQVLGQEITAAYGDRPPHLICVLNGAFIFMADLVRAIDLPVTTDFLSVSSYGSRTATSGEVRLTKDLDQSLKERHVILVEDIVDTGLTMRYLLGYLQGRGPLSVAVATLLSKPSRRMVEVPLDFVGFEIDDAFVYGYGLDVDHRYRNLPFVTSQTADESAESA